MGAIQVGRLEAADGSSISAGIPPDACSIVVLNALSAPIYIVWGDGVPSASQWDMVVPGLALMSMPAPAGVSEITAVVDYPGAVPAGDVGQHAVILVTPNNQGVSVGALA